ncbi:hypothetical protein FJ444_20135 [Aestuariibacter sp. GS-14]|uniref:hypothetical protein n=1 Tax=Aestuariibacter sp. GS-14 TaxID=2590670 RepID=UPI00112A7BB6|nr:hypothetical protein [Aestuariibacter sp. GS-14]TPV53841.1 hypothetical protein FJ444_20135 [Aestuariibacter sp. GS-14]
MQSIIIHKLQDLNSAWVVIVAPHSNVKPSRFESEGLVVTTDSDPSTLELEIIEKYNFKGSFFDDDSLNTISNFASENVPKKFRLKATIPGGFWYRFSNHNEKMSTYIKTNQYLVILEDESYVAAVIGSIGKDIDYSFLQFSEQQSSRISLGNVAKLIVGPGKRRGAIKELQSFTRGARKVSVIDPYILGTVTGKCEVHEQFITLIERKATSDLVLRQLREMQGRSFGSVDKLTSYIKRKISVSDNDLMIIQKIAERLFVKECYVSDFMKAVGNKYTNELNIFFSSSHANSKKVKDDIGTQFSGRTRFCDLDSHEELFVHDRIWVVDSSKAVVVGNSFGGLGMNAISFILPLPLADLEALKKEMKATGIDI